jgi:hypothetical protein
LIISTEAAKLLEKSDCAPNRGMANISDKIGAKPVLVQKNFMKGIY